MKKKYNFMNVLRVLSMIAIVFYHMVFTLYLYGIRQIESVRFLFENTNMHIAKVGVGLFFILSGAGLMLSGKDKPFDIKEFYKKRFIKILIPFYIVYVCYFTFLVITGHLQLANPFSGKDLKPWSFIYTLFGMDAYLENFGIATCSLGIGEWFLGCLIIIYIIYPLLRWAMLKNKYVTLVIATIYYIVINMVYAKIPLFNGVPMYTNLVLKIYDFILGMFLALIIDKLPKWTFILGLLVNLFFVFCPIVLPGINSYQIPIQCLFAFLLFAGLENIFSSPRAEKPMKIVNTLCAYSYEYFLIHHFVILHLSTQGQNTAFGNINILILFAEEIALTTILAVALKKIQLLFTLKKKPSA
jgi:peptidoglycan/LPS O-acetylase OafA/YrhL